jgi:hypothetical protein
VSWGIRQKAIPDTIELGEIAPRRADRVVITGGTRSGKSCLADFFLRYLIAAFTSMEILLLDTKPRFKAEKTAWGKDASRMYSSWRKGPVIPQSVRADLEDDNPLRRVFRHGRIAILQSDRPSGSTMEERKRILEIAHGWWTHRSNGNPRFVIADEGMHFYGKNGWSIIPAMNLFQEIAQTGGELDTGMIFETQLLRGIDSMILDHLSALYNFYLRDIRDIKRLFELGVPRTYRQPEEDYAFHMIRARPGGRLSIREDLSIELPDWYLRQLPAT